MKDDSIFRHNNETGEMQVNVRAKWDDPVWEAVIKKIVEFQNKMKGANK